MILYGGERLRGAVLLQKNESLYFDGIQADKSFNPEFGSPYANAGTYVVGRDGPKLKAVGGDCRILALYEPNLRYGALAHFDVDHARDDNHETLIDRLLHMEPLLRRRTIQPYLFGDKAMQVSRHSISEKAAREWNQRIITTLKGYGMKQPAVYSRGFGKDVRLDTGRGEITVYDITSALLWKHRIPSPRITTRR